MYAVLDIEATGGQMGEEDIIEIAVYRFDGREIVDQLISLVKPERSIDPFVQKLTQITPKMVRTAPAFHEIAKRVIEITEDAVLVGHNVDFDYRMLRQEFKKLGYSYQRDSIDTVKLSEEYFPETNSHSLGKLCKELGIPTTDRHRASGDARATLDLFKIFLEKDALKNISKVESNHQSQKSKEEFGYKGLPNAVGIFYIFNPKNEIIFLSAADNIAQTARKVIHSKSELGRWVREDFENLKFEITGNELISKIKSANELKKIKPKFNSNHQNYNYSIVWELKNGYKTLCIKKSDAETKNKLIEFQSHKAAREMLDYITTTYNLCPKLNKLSAPNQTCFSHEIGECKGACENLEDIGEYNQRVELLLDSIDLENKNFLLIGNGRSLTEKSFIWINNGEGMGYGYFEFHNQIKDVETIKERMTPLEPNPDFGRLIKPYLVYGKYKELISLDSETNH